MKNSDVRSLADWLCYIEKQHAASIRLGLAGMQTVIARAGWSFACPVVTIAGTNGKGSTLTALATLLQRSGKRYGTYTSPHLLHFTERIRLNGVCIAEQALCDAFAVVATWAQGISLTFFEFTTLAAFYLFQQADLDLILLEIGMGGRLDAVNAISPDVAIITSISHDHEAWLGDTIEHIAAEKAGIVRPGIPVVVSDAAAYPIVLEHIASQQARLWKEKEAFAWENESLWVCNKNNLKIKVPRHYLPRDSVSLAMAAYTVLEGMVSDLPILSEAVNSLSDVGMVGRFHRIMVAGTACVLDVAHNQGGVHWLAARLADKTAGMKRRAVWSSLEDKLRPGLVDALCDKVDEWYIADLGAVERAASQDALRAMLELTGAVVHSYETVAKAWDAALAASNKQDEIVVWGSFYTVAQVYAQVDPAITKQEHGLFYE